MSIRDEQKEQRRALIIDKAIELFAKKGYLDTKIGDIAKAADMSVGLMFHYFESKEKLFEEIVRYGTNATNTPREMNFENPLDYFEGFLKVLLQYVKEHPQTMYLFVIIGISARAIRTCSRSRSGAVYRGSWSGSPPRPNWRKAADFPRRIG